MIKKWRKLLSVILAALVLCTMMPVNASANSPVTTITYTDNQGTWVYEVAAKTLISYSGTASSVTIPSSVPYGSVSYAVDRIGSNLFSGSSSLRDLSIPGSIGYIDSAFVNCPNLQTVYIGAGLKSIGYHAFSNCPSLYAMYVHGNPGTGYEAITGCPRVTVYCDSTASSLISYCKSKGISVFY